MKRFIITIIAVLLITAMAVSMSTYSYAQVKGDVNDDGWTDNKDVVALFRYVSAGIKAEDESVYDFNGDGVVDNKDVVDMFRDLCAENAPETSAVPEEQENTEYEIFLYASGEGGFAAGSAEQYNGKKLISFQKSEKQGMDKKSVQIFGHEYELSYFNTYGYGCTDENYDVYIGNNVEVFFGENTGRMVLFSGTEYYDTSGFTFPLNAHSSRQDFIDYAKSLLLEYCGTSTDDCDVEINTVKLKTKYQYTAEDLEQDFINFIDKDPDFSAKYKIKFYKKYKGINRIDDIEVDITSDGKVLLIRAETCDEQFEKFKDTYIDAEQLKKQIKEISYNPSCLSYSILLRAVPVGDELWVMADVNYKYDKNGNIFGSLTQYVTKVAEIPSDQTEPDPYDTEFETWDAYAGTEAE